MKGPVSVGISRPHVQLSQGTVVVGAIFGAWILWLAVNNKLIVYWQILTGAGGAQAGSGGGTTAPAAIPGTGSGGAGQAPGSDPTAPMVIPGPSSSPATPAPATTTPSPAEISSGVNPFGMGF